MAKKSSGILMDTDTVKSLITALAKDTEDKSSKDVLDKIEKMQQEHASHTPTTTDDVAADRTLQADMDTTNLNATNMGWTLAAGAQGSNKLQRTTKLLTSTSPATHAGPGSKQKLPRFRHDQINPKIREQAEMSAN